MKNSFEKSNYPKKYTPLEKNYNGSIYEIGIDEAGRGPLFGRLYVAGVVLAKDSFDTSEIRDSKKLSKKKLLQLYKLITEQATAYHITYIEANEIDEINIREAVMKGMHICAEKIIEILKEKENFDIDDIFLMIDGNDFCPYFYEEKKRVEYKTFLKGDNTYVNIAAASILAKVSRDEYILNLCRKYPILSEKYQMENHKGYGTKKHLEAIKTHGITQFHRKTYGLCKNSNITFI